MSEPTVSFSPPLDSSAPPPPPPSVVLLELELLEPPPHPATTIATTPTRSTAIKAASRVLLNKPASDQEFAGPGRTYTRFREPRLSKGPRSFPVVATLSEVGGIGNRWHQIQ